VNAEGRAWRARRASPDRARGCLRTLASLAGGAMAIVGCGSAPKPPPAPVARVEPPPPIVCSYNTRGLWATAEMRDLPSITWFTFMLPGFRATSGEVARPVINCTGQSIRWGTLPASECPMTESEQAYLPPAPNLGPQDLVIANSSETTRLVWTVTDHLNDGEAEGPVALAEFRPNSVEIRAIGTLRALPERAHLRMVKVQGQTLLVAEGEHCDNADGSRCYRGTRLMILADTRFEPQPVRMEDGRCLEPAFFATDRSQAVMGRDGTRRYMTANGRLDFAPDGVFIHEEVAVRSLDPDGQRPGRLLREARADRRLNVQSGHLFVSDGDLWERMLQEW